MGERTILAVEDEAIILLALKKKIEAFGYRALGALSGEEALKIVGERQVDLILMDVDLGRGLSGPEAAERILDARLIPIIFHTSHAEREMVEKVRGITRYGYVLKNSGDFVLRSSIEMAFELYEAHRKTKHSERRHAAMLQAVPDIMFVVSKDGRIEDFSYHRTVSHLAVPDERVVGANIRDIFPHDEAEAHLALYRACIETGEIQSHYYTLQIDGAPRSYDLRISKIDDDRILAIARDVTRIRRYELDLSFGRTMFKHLAESISDGILVFDEHRRISYASPAYLKMMGYASADELPGSDEEVFAKIHPDDRGPLTAKLNDAFARKTETLIYSYRIMDARGAYFRREDSARFLYDAEGRYFGANVICRDLRGREGCD